MTREQHLKFNFEIHKDIKNKFGMTSDGSLYPFGFRSLFSHTHNFGPLPAMNDSYWTSSSSL